MKYGTSPSAKDSPKSSTAEQSLTSRNYLLKLKEIQLRAKSIMRQNSLINNFPSPPPLEQHRIAQISGTVEHISVPILVPQSVVRRNNKVKPPMMNHVTKTGEVMSIHLLSDSTPVYDPLVKAEAQIAKSSLGYGHVLADIKYNGNQKNRLLKSVSPYKAKVPTFELTPPEGLHAIREQTPREKVERYNFRECDAGEDVVENNRTWVAERMKSYSKQIKEIYRPQVSEKKQVEMEILKEKLRKDKPLGNKRVKLLSIT